MVKILESTRDANELTITVRFNINEAACVPVFIRNEVFRHLRQQPITEIVNSCNRHTDCAAADALVKSRGKLFGDIHCYENYCSECKMGMYG
ncbi:MAG: hypothetical protein UY48_C0042G0011 [Candidatus Gottesmanbacteria bacterium GW2011_GWB1_49_7]|uniref:Uncharacterized protein n=1 Tax=Candidatus Gottesmanbacteria bacterium GW2011_GWB1_49_7 TaxID=1618448 RepID=A0A0G1YV95_9BACT|nr:MAG: hypothetical protein UY48_C0042G0011 [Candidatus Gottesmanbacteria bacterium GW2011_GWB1_49_7]